MKSPWLVCLIGLTLLTACTRQLMPSTEVRCQQAIDKADALLSEQRSAYSPERLQQLENLLKSARIQQQFSQFPGCNDAAHRAIELMQPDPPAAATKPPV